MTLAQVEEIIEQMENSILRLTTKQSSGCPASCSGSGHCEHCQQEQEHEDMLRSLSRLERERDRITAREAAYPIK